LEKQVRTGLISIIHKELDSLPQDDKKLREFGFLMAGVFGLVSAYAYWKNKAYWMWPLLGLTQFLYFAFLWPKALKSVYRGWMFLALLMGWVMTRVILSVFFYLVVTPIGILARYTGGLTPFKKSPKQLESYWTVRPEETRGMSRYEKQF
jgi:hypothetical protein